MHILEPPKILDLKKMGCILTQVWAGRVGGVGVMLAKLVFISHRSTVGIVKKMYRHVHACIYM